MCSKGLKSEKLPFCRKTGIRNFTSYIPSFKKTPIRIIVFGFALLILTASFLLMLPVSSRTGQPTGFTDALFTAASSVCVTGLVVYDTNTYWSSFGHWLILFLIQTGGLGIMTMVTFFFIFLRRNIGIHEKLALQESLNKYSFSGLTDTLLKILKLTFIFEAAGAAVFSIRFIPIYGLGEGIKKSIFHSVSSFCNAGFDLTGSASAPFSSLSAFNRDPLVLLTAAFLIITGGLGFMVWMDISALRKKRLPDLGTKVILTSTAVLLVFGTVFIFLSEYNNPATLGELSWQSKLLNSFFHSVTARTAGFNTLAISEMKDSTNLVNILMMYIGAAPGSTAGGIKVTTFAVIIFSLFSFIKGHSRVGLFFRKVPQTVIFKSFSIFALSIFMVIISVLVLLINREGSLMQVLFESVSAFGTVGLSTEITPSLETASKLQLVLTMFIGRIGPFTAAALFNTNGSSHQKKYELPEGRINVG